MRPLTARESNPLRFFSFSAGLVKPPVFSPSSIVIPTSNRLLHLWRPSNSTRRRLRGDLRFPQIRRSLIHPGRLHLSENGELGLQPIRFRATMLLMEATPPKSIINLTRTELTVLSTAVIQD